MRKLKHKREQYYYHTGTPWVKQYKQINPLDTNPETGEILNLTKNIILEEKEPINMQDHIQSFEEEQDIKNLIKRMEAGDETAHTGRQGEYIEEELPEDFHTMSKEIERLNKKLQEYEKETKEHANNTRNEPIQQEHSVNNETKE